MQYTKCLFQPVYHQFRRYSIFTVPTRELLVLSTCQNVKNRIHLSNNLRCITTTPVCGFNIEFERLPRKHGIEDQRIEYRSDYEILRDECKLLPEEFTKLYKEMKHHMTTKEAVFCSPGDEDIYMDFKDPATYEKWAFLSDRDHKNGFSSGSLTMSPSGYGLFSGYLDKTVPKVGKKDHAGYCNMSTLTKYKAFLRVGYIDWSDYTHMVLRVRGDGRTYMIILNTARLLDVTWHTVYGYPLHTRGGPYWQETKIPFSKFCSVDKGRILEEQAPTPRHSIRSLGISVTGQISAPFRLEIDNISVACDHNKHTELSAYEVYKSPTIT